MTDVNDLLQKTSRTFALTIPYLPPPTREEVGLAYLLFRIIDTFEDATRWSPEQRIAAHTASSCRCWRRPTRRTPTASPSAAAPIRPSTTPAIWSCCGRSRSCCRACTRCRSAAARS